MAYMNKERKNERAPAIKKILKEYGMKGTLSVKHHSTLVLKIKDVRGLFTEQFEVDPFRAEYGLDINVYHYEKHFAHNPEIVEMFDKLTAEMYGKDYFDESDIMTDYFHRSHYIDIVIFPEENLKKAA